MTAGKEWSPEWLIQRAIKKQWGAQENMLNNVARRLKKLCIQSPKCNDHSCVKIVMSVGVQPTLPGHSRAALGLTIVIDGRLVSDAVL